MSESPKPRRIITGIGADGRSHIARVEEVEQLDYSVGYPGQARAGEDRVVDLYRMWAYDSFPIQLPTDGLIPPLDDEVTVNGHVVRRPASPDETPEVLRRVSAQPHRPGGIRISVCHFRQSQSGDKRADSVTHMPVHWHPTVDVRFVIDGECTLIMDSGEEVAMRRGDCVISHSDNHTWDIPHPDGCTFGIIMIGGEVVGEMPPAEQELTHVL